MTTIIVLISIMLFAILLILIWNRLSTFELRKKIITCVLALIICLSLTLIIFSISSKGIQYQNLNEKQTITKTFVAIFTPVNGIILIPYLVKVLNDIRTRKINKEQTKRKLIIFIILLVIGTIIEINYFKNIQLGIIEYSKSI